MWLVACSICTLLLVVHQSFHIHHSTHTGSSLLIMQKKYRQTFQMRGEDINHQLVYNINLSTYTTAHITPSSCKRNIDKTKTFMISGVRRRRQQWEESITSLCSRVPSPSPGPDTSPSLATASTRKVPRWVPSLRPPRCCTKVRWCCGVLVVCGVEVCWPCFPLYYTIILGK